MPGDLIDSSLSYGVALFVVIIACVAYAVSWLYRGKK